MWLFGTIFIKTHELGFVKKYCIFWAFVYIQKRGEQGSTAHLIAPDSIRILLRYLIFVKLHGILPPLTFTKNVL